MKYLFIGGVADGEWRETTGEEIVNIQAPKPIVARDPEAPLEMFPSMSPNCTLIQYRIRTWVCDEKVIYIYTPEGDSDFVTFQQLLKGYRPA